VICLFLPLLVPTVGGGVACRLSERTSSRMDQAPTAESREHVEEIARTLPNTAFRKFIESAEPGSGVRQSYMHLMEKEGVKRAVIEIHGVWRHEWVWRDWWLWRHDLLTEPKVTYRMYFSKYDGRGARIRDAEVLRSIQARSLEGALDQAALEAAKDASQFCVDNCTSIEGKRVRTRVELYDNPWFSSGVRVVSSEEGPQTPLFDTASFGDTVKLSEVLQSRQFTQQELNRALFESVHQYRDNTEVMELLIRAGADVNSHLGDDGTTLLMAALHNPVHIKFLLDAGERVNDKNRYGTTALIMAEMAKAEDSVKLLKQAGAVP